MQMKWRLFINDRKAYTINVRTRVRINMKTSKNLWSPIKPQNRLILRKKNVLFNTLEKRCRNFWRIFSIDWQILPCCSCSWGLSAGKGDVFRCIQMMYSCLQMQKEVCDNYEPFFVFGTKDFIFWCWKQIFVWISTSANDIPRQKWLKSEIREMFQNKGK